MAIKWWWSLVPAALLFAGPLRADAPRTLWEELNSPATQSATGAYDPIRHQMVMVVQVSGGSHHEVWAYDFDGPDPEWKHLLPYNADFTVFPTTDWGMAYDALRDRFVSTGGWALSTATDPPQWIPLGNLTTAHRNGAVLDPYLDRLVNFAGNGTVQTLSLGSPTTWSTLATSGSPPPAGNYVAVYDTDHRRMIAFGGPTGNGVWALTLPGAGTPTWSQIIPIAGPPAGREGAVAVFDAYHRRMIVMGGRNGANHYGDTWELSLVPGSEQWSLLSNSGAPAYHAAAADDSLNDRMIVFAAENGSTANQLQSFSLGGGFAWTRHSPQSLDVPMLGNPGSMVTPCVYDPVRHQLVEYSGDQLWGLPLDGHGEWMPLATATAGPNLGGHTMVYDPGNDRLVIFGGVEVGVGYSNTLRTLTLEPPRTWGTLAPSGSPPQARTGSSSIYDPLGHRMLIFGGTTLGGTVNQVFGIALDGPASWTPLATTNPPGPRVGALTIYDPVRQRMVLHGGSNTTTEVYDDTWTLPLDGGPLDWTHLVPDGAAPVVQFVPACYDPVRDRMMVISGDPPQVNALSFAGDPAWSAVETFGSPPPTLFQDLGGVFDPDSDRMVAMTQQGNPWSLRFDVPGQLDVPPDPGPSPSALAISAVRPNPSRGTFAIECRLPQRASTTVELFDVRGRRVFRDARGAVDAGVRRFDVRPAGGLEPGIYFVRVRQADRSASARVAIMK